MADSQRWIRKHWTRLQWGRFLGVCGDQLAMALIGCGSIVLLMKLFAPLLLPYAPFLLVVLALVPFWSWRSVTGRSFSEQEATALLDSKLQAGGLLMTLAEAPDHEWQRRLPQLEELWRDSLPRIRPKRFASLVSLPALFAVAACLIPAREFSAANLTPKPIAQQASDDLETMLKTLEEADILEEKEKEELKQELSQLIEETKNQPLTHEQWETVDSLRQQMQLSWSKNERNLESASNAVDQLLSEMANDGEVSAEQLEKLENMLGQNLENLASKACDGNCPNLSPELKKQLEKLSQSGKMSLPSDSAERQKMLDELKKMLQEEKERLEKQRKECQGNCQGEGFCDKQGDGNCEKPGKGGISRGRGDAPLTWGEESDKDGTKFKDVVLPPGFLDQPSDQVLGLTYKEPEVDPGAVSPRNASSERDPAAGRATWDRKLSPKHRQSVQKFFDSQRSTKEIPKDAEL